MITLTRAAPALALCLAACATATTADDASPRAIHERALTLDTHLDTPALMGQPGWDLTQRHDPRQDFSQVDLPRMIEGGLDGGFWVIYTPQGPLGAEPYAAARDAALRRAVTIRDAAARYNQHFELAYTADDAERIAASGKRIMFISIENGYPIGEDLSLMTTFYLLGARMFGPVHFANNQFGDSATDPNGPRWNGLSPLGRQAVAEANRLGMVLDASHASDAVFDEMLTLSRTPIILSHTGAKAIYDHPRNLDDERLRRLAAAGGVIQVNSLGAYLTPLPPSPERQAALRALRGSMPNAPAESLSAAQALQMLQARRQLEAQFPAPQATFDDFMRHLLHILEVVGPEHVGIGADFDGGGGVVGMQDVADFPKITERLLAAGYSEADIRNIWGGNTLRVLRAAEAYARNPTPAP